jgi:pimeloyl-ACP methyl ester carboxylesterase
MMFGHHVEVDNVRIHVVEHGAPDGPAVVFLHGWPQSWRSFERVMHAAGDRFRSIALDLPGIGESHGALNDGRKTTIAHSVHQVIAKLELRNVTLVGHDVGGQVAFAYLMHHAQDLSGVVIMNVVIPGLAPWDKVIRNPRIWHFAFHAVPDLPEKLVSGREEQYFAFFFDALTRKRDAIDDRARRLYAAAYSSENSLRTGFDWYRAFEEDAKENVAFARGSRRVSTSVVYVRGSHEYGDIADYAQGLRDAGVGNLQTAVIPDCGHFAPEEAPEAVWALIARLVDQK